MLLYSCCIRILPKIPVIFLVYLFGYGVGRFWIEGLRTDQLQFFNGVAVSQVLAAVLVVVSAVLLVVGRKKIVPIEQKE